MKGIIYYAPTAQRAKHVSHSNVGAEHCSALIDQRDRLRFSGLDALGRKTTLSLRYVTSRKGVRESHLAVGWVHFVADSCRISSEGHNGVAAPTLLKHAFKKGYRYVGILAKRVLPLNASCDVLRTPHRVGFLPSAS